MARTYEPIASTTLGSAAASYEFTSIPGTFTDLVLVVFAAVSSGTYSEDTTLRFNGDTGNNYSYTNLEGTGSAAQSYRRSSYPYISEIFLGDSGTPSPAIIHIMSYANTNVNKTVLITSSKSAFRVGRGVGLWRNTAAITSIKVEPYLANLESGATLSLYGIKAA